MNTKTIKSQYIRNFFTIKLELMFDFCCFPVDKARKIFLKLNPQNVKNICKELEMLFTKYKYQLFPNPKSNVLDNNQHAMYRCLSSLAIWLNRKKQVPCIKQFTVWNNKFLHYFLTEYRAVLRMEMH